MFDPDVKIHARTHTHTHVKKLNKEIQMSLYLRVTVNGLNVKWFKLVRVSFHSQRGWIALWKTLCRYLCCWMWLSVATTWGTRTNTQHVSPDSTSWRGMISCVCCISLLLHSSVERLQEEEREGFAGRATNIALLFSQRISEWNQDHFASVSDIYLIVWR